MSNEQRDELARDIAAALGGGNASVRAITNVAEALIAAGYRKPRTITTHEELDALPEGSVIHSGEGAVFEKCHSGWIETGRGGVMDPEDIALPATVIHEPTTEATK